MIIYIHFVISSVSISDKVVITSSKKYKVIILALGNENNKG